MKKTNSLSCLSREINRPSYFDYQNGIYVPLSTPEVTDPLKPIRPRPSQIELINDYVDERYLIVNIPCGGGKSIAIKYMYALALIQNPNLKLIISVPQNIIANGFAWDCKLEYPNGEIIDWKIVNNLCNRSSSEVVKGLTKFMNQRGFPSNFHNRIMLCSHNALAIAFKNAPSRTNLFKDTILCIDEAHRISMRVYGDEIVSSEDEVFANDMGDVINYAIDNSNARVSLFTATYFRGDKKSILTDAHEKLFKTYFMSLEKHWKENLRDLKHIKFDYVTCSESPFGLVQDLCKKKVPTLVIVPPKGQSWAANNKDKFTNDIINSINSSWKKANVLDLVTLSGREKRIEEFHKNPDYDVIVACQLFNEGANWERLTQTINLDPSNSLNRTNQTFGRLGRHYPNKHTIYYYSVMNCSGYNLKDLKTEENRKKYTEHFTNIIGAQTMSDYILPTVKTFMPNLSASETENEHESAEKAISYFCKEIPDLNDQCQIRQDIAVKLQDLEDKFKKLKKEPEAKDLSKCIVDVLEPYNIKNKDKIALEILVYYELKSTKDKSRRKQLLKVHGDDESNIAMLMVQAGFDKIVIKDVFEGLKNVFFSSGLLDQSVFAEFREIYSGINSADKNKEILLEMARSGCERPSHKTFLGRVLVKYTCKSHGSYDLEFDTEIRDLRPDWFINKKTIEEHIKTAESLAKDNSGVLPCYSTLMKSHSDLAHCINRNKKRFEHIIKENRKTTLEEHIKTAERLAESNDGFLPSTRILKQSNMQNLIAAMSAYKKEFSHISTKKERLYLLDYIEQANEIASKNGGKLPPQLELDSNLRSFIQRYPEKFNHLSQERLRINSKELAPLKHAQKIILNNNIRSVKDYNFFRIEYNKKSNPKLPSNPVSTYQIKWSEFLQISSRTRYN